MDPLQERWHLSKSVPISIIVFLIVQTIGLVIWATRLDFRVNDLEGAKIDLKLTIQNETSEQNRRISALEALYPELAKIQVNLEYVNKRLDSQSLKIDKLLDAVSSLSKDPPSGRH